MKDFQVYLLGVGEFQAQLDSPTQGVHRLSAQDDAFSMLLIETEAWFPHYDYKEIQEDILAWTQERPFTIFTTLSSCDGDMRTATTNLRGPLVVDWEKGKIRQFVLYSGKYPLKAVLAGKEEN